VKKAFSQEKITQCTAVREALGGTDISGKTPEKKHLTGTATPVFGVEMVIHFTFITLYLCLPGEISTDFQIYRPCVRIVTKKYISGLMGGTPTARHKNQNLFIDRSCIV
jgi:hypothetical protein